MAPVDRQTIVKSLVADAGTGRWNALEPQGSAEVVAYSFPRTRPSYLSADQAQDFQPLDAYAKAVVRDALDAWSEATGLRFVAYDADVGNRAPQLSFAADSELTGESGFSGFAYLPFVSAFGESAVGGDVFFDPGAMTDRAIDSGTFRELALHEIGHAIGLKHPFAGDQQLPSSADNTNNTVMSYTRAGGLKAEPQEFDVIAARALYGAPSDTNYGVDDVTRLANGVARVQGSDADDEIAGYDGPERLFGGGGDDAIRGGQGADFIQGNTGRDTLTDRGGDLVMRGGADDDTLRVGGPGVKRIFGDKGADLIIARGDKVWVEGGNPQNVSNPREDQDRLVVHSDGDDFIQANIGNDRVEINGAGRDIVRGGKNHDRLDVSGASGRNDVYGDKGADVLILGDGTDIVHVAPGTGNDRVIDFDPEQDSMAFDGATGLGEVYANQDGDTVVDVANSGEVTLIGVDPTAFDDALLG